MKIILANGCARISAVIVKMVLHAEEHITEQYLMIPSIHVSAQYVCMPILL